MEQSNTTWTQEQWEKERDLALSAYSMPPPSLYDRIREKLNKLVDKAHDAGDLANILRVAEMLDRKEPETCGEVRQVYCPCGSTTFEGGKCKHCLRPKFWNSLSDIKETK